MPFITCWKGMIEPGTSDALVCHVDLLSSIASLVDSDEKGPDSQNLMETFLGKSDRGRDDLVLEAKSRTAYRKGNWVMIPPYDEVAVNTKVNIELGNAGVFQLYNLETDPTQQINLAEENPGKLQEMKSDFEKVRGNYENVEKLELK